MNGDDSIKGGILISLKENTGRASGEDEDEYDDDDDDVSSLE